MKNHEKPDISVYLIYIYNCSSEPRELVYPGSHKVLTSQVALVAVGAWRCFESQSSPKIRKDNANSTTNHAYFEHPDVLPDADLDHLVGEGTEGRKEKGKDRVDVEKREKIVVERQGGGAAGSERERARYVSRKKHNGISDRSKMATGSGTTVSRVWGISTGRENAQEMKLSIAEALRDLKQVQWCLFMTEGWLQSRVWGVSIGR
ncbi:hypothetical protein B0H13DRAFT_1899402 [Mycena leptocephala]|nr:hypothetical protein B0H13DRAFT_1899402 [Mycena leptocephala]